MYIYTFISVNIQSNFSLGNSHPGFIVEETKLDLRESKISLKPCHEKVKFMLGAMLSWHLGSSEKQLVQKGSLVLLLAMETNRYKWRVNQGIKATVFSKIA